MAPGRRYDILDFGGVVFNAAGGGIVGGFALLAGRPRLIFFPIGLAILLFVIHTLCHPYRLQITDSGALEFKTVLSTSIVNPHTIRFIRTRRQLIWWEGADARVIHIIHDRGKKSVPNFDGAEALFTELILKYPNIQADKLDFQPDIRD